MKTPLSSQWLLYSASGVPLWCVLIGLTCILVLTHRWLQAERGIRRSIAARILPWTWTGLLLLAALFVYRPVVQRIDTWTRSAAILTWSDPSSSMQEPLGGSTATVRLDALAFWTPNACAGRNTAPRTMARIITRALKEAEMHLSTFERYLQETAQGLPLSEQGRDQLVAAATWGATLKAQVTDGSAQVLDTLRAVTGEDDAVAAMKALGAWGRALSADAPADDTTAVARRVEALRDLVAQSRVVLPVLHELQITLDTRYAEQEKERLAPLFAEKEQKPRADAAAHLAETLPQDAREKAAPVREADVALAEMARYSESHILSHAVLFSDGGHLNNVISPSTAAVGKRLREAGVSTYIVGTGLAEQTRDLAIRDWECPRMARAGRSTDIRVIVKTPLGEKAPYTLVLSEADEQLASIACTSTGRATQTISFSFKAPSKGRHILRLRITEKDDHPQNNEVRFAFDAVKKTPKLLILGDTPDWDTAYLALAAGRLTVKLSQLYYGTKAPSRGRDKDAVPESATEWKRYGAVVLRGAAFPGFTDKDAEALRDYVTAGGNLIVFDSGDTSSYAHALASAFAWEATAQETTPGELLATNAADSVPFLRLGTGGAQSAHILQHLGRVTHATPVAPQQWTLMETSNGDPLLTVGLYGRGRVYLCGARGLYRLREYENAAIVDRLLSQWLGDAVCSTAVEKDARLLVYPPLPQPGAQALLSLPGDAAQVLGADKTPLALSSVPGGQATRIATPSENTLSLTLAGTQATWPQYRNPDAETVDYTFDEAYLTRLADTVGAHRLTLEETGELASITPSTWQQRTAQTWRPTHHWLAFVLLLMIGTTHWVLRKIAGLAI